MVLHFVNFSLGRNGLYCYQISGIIVDKSGRDYSGNMENAQD